MARTTARRSSRNDAATLTAFAAALGHEGPLRGPWGAAGLGAARRPADRAMTEALIGLAAMMALSFLRVPIAISMGLVGFLGLW